MGPEDTKGAKLPDAPNPNAQAVLTQTESWLSRNSGWMLWVAIAVVMVVGAWILHKL